MKNWMCNCRRIIILAFVLLPVFVNAQIKKTFDVRSETPASAASDTALTDSLLLDSLRSEVQQLRLNEILLRSELSGFQSSLKDDSLKKVAVKASIDSLRLTVKGLPVVVDGDTVLTLYSNFGGVRLADRCQSAGEVIGSLGEKLTLSPDSVYLMSALEGVTEIMYDGRVILSVSDNDALWMDKSRTQLAEDYKASIVESLKVLKEKNGLSKRIQRALMFVLVLAVLILSMIFTGWVFRKLRRVIVSLSDKYLHPIFIKEYEFLTVKRQTAILLVISRLLRFGVYIILLVFCVPMFFYIFPQTKTLSYTLFSYIMIPVKSIFGAVLEYIPNLFTIAIIYLIINYIIRGVRYVSNEIECGHLKISGFYPDLARPTYNIIKFLLYAFMLAMVYPYLPGSQSGVFQGISVFVGLIFSLGSTALIGNITAGLVITYMRPFKVGDRIQFNDKTGNVIEKSLLVTRIRTPKNEIITIPNSFVMSSHTTNYTVSARQYGLIIHTTVTIGYDVPWRQVHQLLIDAARCTPGVSQHPEPFVLETELSDFYPVYQLNAYIKEADNQAAIYSRLHQNIQDQFNTAGVEILSPHYRAERDGNESTIPKNGQVENLSKN